MIYRYFPSGLHLWKINIVVTVMLLSISTGKKNPFYPVNSCTDIKLKDIPVDVFQTCTQSNLTIHCVPDENKNLGLSCFQVTWITKDKCPSYNSYQGNMDETDCSTDYNGICPGGLYKSPLSVIYTGCYIKELIARTTAPSMTTKTMTTMTSTTSTEPSSESMANDSLIGESTTETHQTGVSESGKGWMGAFIFILLLVVAMIAAVCIVYKRKLCNKCKQTIRKEFRRVKPKFCCNREAQNDPQPQDRDDGSRKPMVNIYSASKRNGS